MQNVQEQINMAVELGKGWLQKHGEIDNPLFFAELSTGHAVFATDGSMSKEQFFQALAMTFALEGVTSFMMLSEGWNYSVKPLPGETAEQCEARAIKQRAGKSVRDTPGSFEALMVFYISHDDSFASNFKIIRDGAGKIKDFEPLAENDKMHITGGNVKNLLPPKGYKPPAGAARIAQMLRERMYCRADRYLKIQEQN